jgi:predicted dienelactone hydrolase
VFRLHGDGPLPLVVMNHGTTQNPVQRRHFLLLEFEAAALWLAKQGFVVAASPAPRLGGPRARAGDAYKSSAQLYCTLKRTTCPA